MSLASSRRSAYSPAERGSRRGGTGRATKDFVPYITTAGEVRRREHAERPSPSSVDSFQNDVWSYWKKEGRHDLPWRQPSPRLRRGKKDFDPYKILVSEVMLQQTQVPRVIKKYKEFLHVFPNVESLARSKLSDVLKVWSGMGYNRRGKYLRDAAVTIVEKYGGKVPRDIVSLRSLPGIGPYTASAVLIFAFNIPDTLIETNVRSAYIHHFFAQKYKAQSLAKKISDRELLPCVEAAAEGQDPRTWHWALMDYGSNLKKLHKNPSRASTHYVKQSKFEGSLRQARGAILRALYKKPFTERTLSSELGVGSSELGKFRTALAGLVRDGMITKVGRQWRIAEV